MCSRGGQAPGQEGAAWGSACGTVHAGRPLDLVGRQARVDVPEPPDEGVRHQRHVSALPGAQQAQQQAVQVQQLLLRWPPRRHGSRQHMRADHCAPPAVEAQAAGGRSRGGGQIGRAGPGHHVSREPAAAPTVGAQHFISFVKPSRRSSNTRRSTAGRGRAHRRDPVAKISFVPVRATGRGQISASFAPWRLPGSDGVIIIMGCRKDKKGARKRSKFWCPFWSTVSPSPRASLWFGHG